MLLTTRFSRWRQARPFWAGALVLMSGLELLSIPFATSSLPLVISSGTAGATYLLGLVLVLLGALLWLQPAQRVFLGVVATLLAVASFVYSNLGGFGVGMILGLVGGGMGAAWIPPARSEPDSGPPVAKTLALLPLLLAVPSPGLVVASEPATLQAVRLTMSGFRFDGVHSVRTSGGMMDLLRFSMDRAILHSPKQAAGGAVLRAASLTLSSGVVVYVRTLYGKPLGLLPLKLSADHPDLVATVLRALPKLPLPLTLTNVVVDQPVVVAGVAHAAALDQSAYP